MSESVLFCVNTVQPKLFLFRFAKIKTVQEIPWHARIDFPSLFQFKMKIVLPELYLLYLPELG